MKTCYWLIETVNHVWRERRQKRNNMLRAHKTYQVNHKYKLLENNIKPVEVRVNIQLGHLSVVASATLLPRVLGSNLAADSDFLLEG